MTCCDGKCDWFIAQMCHKSLTSCWGSRSLSLIEFHSIDNYWPFSILYVTPLASYRAHGKVCGTLPIAMRTKTKYLYIYELSHIILDIYQIDSIWFKFIHIYTIPTFITQPPPMSVDYNSSAIIELYLRSKSVILSQVILIHIWEYFFVSSNKKSRIYGTSDLICLS